MFTVVRGKKSRGFTLIELLVVVGIIAVLAALSLTVIGKVRRGVQNTQTAAELAMLASAIQQYYNDFHAYPGPLPNSQLDSSYDGSQAPFVYDPVVSGQKDVLVGTDGTNHGTVLMAGTANMSTVDQTLVTHITGAENLVLGLCGGLQVYGSGNPPTSYTFEYHPEMIFGPDGMTPNPRGPQSLGGIPKKPVGYLSLKLGDLSVPNNTVNNGQFSDSPNVGSRHSSSCFIPEFLDKYNAPLPILYYRTNAGGSAIAGFRNTLGTATSVGSLLVDTDTTHPGAGAPLVAQYDLAQNIAYTYSTTSSPGIGLVSSQPNSFHGLQGLGSANLSDPIDTNVGGATVTSNAGSNGLAYFKDPSLNTSNSTNYYQGTARQKDGFILISAGPDRIYGSHDDIVYPGPLLP